MTTAVNQYNSDVSATTVTVSLGISLLIMMVFLINFEMQNRKISAFVTGIGQQNKSASVLDSLPDGIIIADSKQISYLN